METILIFLIVIVAINLFSAYALDKEIKTISIDKCKPHVWEYNKEGIMYCRICKLNTKESLGK